MIFVVAVSGLEHDDRLAAFELPLDIGDLLADPAPQPMPRAAERSGSAAHRRLA